MNSMVTSHLCIDDAVDAYHVHRAAVRSMFDAVGDFYPEVARRYDWEHVSVDHVRRRFGNSLVFQILTRDASGSAAGYSFGEIHGSSGFGFIHFFGVIPEAQGTGVADDMMDFVLKFLGDQRCHKVSLVTFPVNTRAIRFYERHGMTKEGVLRRHWWGVDHLQMSIWLDEI